ncbi:MAG: HNH endonuclease [Acidimicrobiales bacterium]|jgi:5-methylcytosine-specific restriction endonuclease McrA|nr:HNH endonuclease [Acidimicrobiales bacterium]
MGGSLVLNATYEPLSIVSPRRAVVLVLAEKADVVQETGQEFRSSHLQVPVPSVIRLRAYVKVPYQRHAPLSRRAVFLRDGGRCQYCGRGAENIDHVVPRSRGGQHVWENVVAACGRCNATKRDRLLEETPMRLRSHPQVPRQLSWVRVAVGHVPTTWEPYLVS